MVLESSSRENESLSARRSPNVYSKRAKMINRNASRRRRHTDSGSRRHLERSRRQTTAQRSSKSVSIPPNNPPGQLDRPQSIVVSNTVSIPRRLPRPEFVDISKETLAAVDPDLLGTDVEYIRDKLRQIGPLMLEDVKKVKVMQALTEGPLPKEVMIQATDIQPSYMLAVWGPSTSNSATKLTLWPAHAIVLASMCSKLPPDLIRGPHQSRGIPYDTQGSKDSCRLVVPVHSLRVPSPDDFGSLFSFLYNRDRKALLRHFLPHHQLSTSIVEEIPDWPSVERRRELATFLSETYTVRKLLQNVSLIHGVWQNATVLGVFDDDLWGVLEFAYDTLFMSVAIGSGNPQVVLNVKEAHV